MLREKDDYVWPCLDEGFIFWIVVSAELRLRKSFRRIFSVIAYADNPVAEPERE